MLLHYHYHMGHGFGSFFAKLFSKLAGRTVARTVAKVARVAGRKAIKEYRHHWCITFQTLHGEELKLVSEILANLQTH